MAEPRTKMNAIILVTLLQMMGCCSSNGGSRRTVLNRVKRQFPPFPQDDSPSQVVMSCDIKEDGFSHQDALVLNLRFAQDSNEIVTSLKKQQERISENMDEIWDMIKKTEREQARLNQLQQAVLQQNAQIMAIVGSMQKNENIGSQNLFRTGYQSPYANPSGPPPETAADIERSFTQTLIAQNVGGKGDILQRSISLNASQTSSKESVVHEFDIMDDPLQNLRAKEKDTSVADLSDQEFEQMCGECTNEEYCVISDGNSQCYFCTECALGYMLTSPCTRDRDVICQDINECTTVGAAVACPDEQTTCMNTPGGYVCLGGDATCADDYFFNRRSFQCELCSVCERQHLLVVPCSKFSDAICSVEGTGRQTDVWRGALFKPNKMLKAVTDLKEGYSLRFEEVSHHNQTFVDLVHRTGKREKSEGATGRNDRKKENLIIFERHGLAWLDFNSACLHSCRSYIQVSFMMSYENDGAKSLGASDIAVLGDYRPDDTSATILSATRVEFSRGDRYKPINMAAIAEVQPGQRLRVHMESAHRGCAWQSTKLDQSGFKSIAANHKSGPFSLLWLSHDTGVVAFRATTKIVPAFSTLRAAFTKDYASDFRVVNLSHDGRHFIFSEGGIILVKYHQALYTIGESCVSQGYTMSANIAPANASNALQSQLSMKSHKSGVTYTDTALSITTLAQVAKGDRLSFDVITPARCQVRYMSDLNLGVVNLLWIPQHSATAFVARLYEGDDIRGSLKSKILRFLEIQNTNSEKIGLTSSSYIEFKDAGRAHISFMIRSIHSCDYLRTTLHYLGTDSSQPVPLGVINQVIGDTSGRWDGILMGGSISVEAGSRCYVTLTCTRGRINEISYGDWSRLSVLWVPL